MSPVECSQRQPGDPTCPGSTEEEHLTPVEAEKPKGARYKFEVLQNTRLFPEAAQPLLPRLDVSLGSEQCPC